MDETGKCACSRPLGTDAIKTMTVLQGEKISVAVSRLEEQFPIFRAKVRMRSAIYLSFNIRRISGTRNVNSSYYCEKVGTVWRGSVIYVACIRLSNNP